MRQRGVTIIELLVAMTVSGLVIVLVSRIFLTGHAQSLLRSRESELLKQHLALAGTMEKRILSDGAASIELGAMKAHYPNLDSMSLKWFKADTTMDELVQVQNGEDGTFATWEEYFSWGPVKLVGKGSLVR